MLAELKLTGRCWPISSLGNIKNWNDGDRQRSPDLKLPATNIAIHRSGPDRATFNWARDSGQVSPVWKSKMGEGRSIKWVSDCRRKRQRRRRRLCQADPELDRLRRIIARCAEQYGLGRFVQNAAGKFTSRRAAELSSRGEHQTGPMRGLQSGYDKMRLGPTPTITALDLHSHYFCKGPKGIKMRSRAALKFFKWALASSQDQASSTTATLPAR